jgi:hypothetical protein
MTAYVKVDGSWKEVSPQAKINGEWKTLNSGYVKVQGLWKEFYQSFKNAFVAISPYVAAVSTDGIKWSENPIPAVGFGFAGITYGDGIFVATTNGTSSTPNDAIAATSADGVTWSSNLLPLESDCRAIAFGNGRFVTIGYGSNLTAWSNDGSSWNLNTMPSVQNWANLSYGNGIFVVTTNTAAAAHSTNGVTWTATTLSQAGSWSRAIYGNGIFVTVGFFEGVANTSTDGITWTARTLPSATSWRDITFGNGIFVAIASNTTTVIYSTDSITWSSSTMPSAARTWWKIAYYDGIFTVVCSGSTATAGAYSTNGITWTATTMPSSSSWREVASKLNPEIFSVTIPGTCNVGSPIIPSISYFANPEPTFSYQWQRSFFEGGAWNNISGATSSSYTPTSDDSGSLFRVVVTASNIHNINYRSSNTSVERTTLQIA